MMDKDFSPIDAASLVAWFAWAEANATRLRRRLDDLGADWQDPAPKHVPWGPKSDPAVRRTGWTVTTRRRPLQDPEIGTAGGLGLGQLWCGLAASRIHAGCILPFPTTLYREADSERDRP